MSTEAEVSKKWKVDVTVEVQGRKIVVPITVEGKKPVSGRVARRMAEESADDNIRIHTTIGTAKAEV